MYVKFNFKKTPIELARIPLQVQLGGPMETNFLVNSKNRVTLSPGQTDSQVDASLRLAFDLRFVWPPTCDNLRGLALTCVDFGRAQI